MVAESSGRPPLSVPVSPSSICAVIPAHLPSGTHHRLDPRVPKPVGNEVCALRHPRHAKPRRIDAAAVLVERVKIASAAGGGHNDRTPSASATASTATLIMRRPDTAGGEEITDCAP